MLHLWLCWNIFQMIYFIRKVRFYVKDLCKFVDVICLPLRKKRWAHFSYDWCPLFYQCAKILICCSIWKVLWKRCTYMFIRSNSSAAWCRCRFCRFYSVSIYVWGCYSIYKRPGRRLNIKTVCTRYGIPMLKIRRLPVRRRLFIETRPPTPHTRSGLTTRW